MSLMVTVSYAIDIVISMVEKFIITASITTSAVAFVIHMVIVLTVTLAPHNSEKNTLFYFNIDSIFFCHLGEIELFPLFKVTSICK